MPQRPPRPCRAKLCRNTTRERHGYCPDHAREASGWERHHKGKSSTARGYGARWRRLRALVLERDRYLCQCEECQRLGRVRPAGEVDHVTPKAQGGTDAPDNLRAIARDCHRRKTQAEALAGHHRPPRPDPSPRR